MKKGFTLVELIISVFLLGMIVYFLYSSIADLQKSNQIFEQKSQNSFMNQRILSMMQKDIFYATKLSISGHENSLVDMQSANSIFEIDYPYVTWLLKPDLKKLVRFESTLPFKNMNIKNSSYYHMSIINKECQKYKVYQSKDKESILIYIKFKNEDPLVYELFKPLKPMDTNKTKKKKYNRFTYSDQ